MGRRGVTDDFSIVFGLAKNRGKCDRMRGKDGVEVGELMLRVNVCSCESRWPKLLNCERFSKRKKVFWIVAF